MFLWFSVAPKVVPCSQSVPGSRASPGSLVVFPSRSRCVPSRFAGLGHLLPALVHFLPAPYLLPRPWALISTLPSVTSSVLFSPAASAVLEAPRCRCGVAGSPLPHLTLLVVLQIFSFTCAILSIRLTRCKILNHSFTLDIYFKILVLSFFIHY